MPRTAWGSAAVVLRPLRRQAAVRSIYDNGIVTDAYAAAGVDTRQADRGVAPWSRSSARSRPGASASVPLPGHYASVIRIAPNLGVALATDSVGSKVIVAEQARRFYTIGIDCVAMNVNDLICVGAEPLALLDYLAVEQADPALLARAGRGPARRRRGCRRRDPRRRGVPATRGHPWPPVALRVRPRAARPSARSRSTRSSTAGHARPGDALIGLPASGVHSNGLTLARRALLDDGGLALDDAAAASSAARASPTSCSSRPSIYVRAVLELLRSDVAVHGLAHITGGGLPTCCGSATASASRSPRRCPCPPVFALIAELRRRRRRGDVGGLQHGLRLLRRGPGASTPTTRWRCSRARHPGTARDRPRDRRRRTRRASPRWALDRRARADRTV